MPLCVTRNCALHYHNYVSSTKRISTVGSFSKLETLTRTFRPTCRTYCGDEKVLNLFSILIRIVYEAF